MTWDEIRHDDKREHEQLDVARALIEDATRDTTVWIGSASLGYSAEEKVHVLAMQRTLTDLARIVERRIEGRHEVRDAWEWSEGVRDVLLRLEQAKQLRGSIVGKGLARLPEHLPHQLPGSRPRRRAPAPVRPVSTGFSVISREPKPTKLPPDPPAYFPGELWPETSLVFLRAQRKFPVQTQTLEFCKHVLENMKPIFVEAVKTRKMSAYAVLTKGHGGMADMLHSLVVYNDDGPRSSGFASLSREGHRLEEEARKSDEWLKLAEAVAEADRLRASGKQTEPSHAQNSDKSAQSMKTKPASAEAGAKERIAQNIEKLRKECGWSYDHLANATGIDKKLVLSHAHMKHTPKPSTRREYAQAFTKKLGRPITANNLEE